MDSQYSRIRKRLGHSRKSKVEKFLSSHPERYGLNEEYAGAAIVEMNGVPVEAEPFQNYDAGKRILRQIPTKDAVPEAFISSHPERYGYDNEKYSEALVIQEKENAPLAPEQVIEVTPRRSYKGSSKALKKLKKEYGIR